jgi:hypothetical protein
MSLSKPDWKTNDKLAAGKGATVQEFIATVEDDKLQSTSRPGARVI